MTIECPDCGFEVDPAREVRCPCGTTDLDPKSNTRGEPLR